jgi:hypothetical protein
VLPVTLHSSLLQALKVHRLLAKDSKQFRAAVFQKVQSSITRLGVLQNPLQQHYDIIIQYEQRA